jgi:hypothetical protein
MPLCATLDSFLDLKPKLNGRVSEEDQSHNLRSIMKHNCEIKMTTSETARYTWETDYDFYIDQFQVCQINSLVFRIFIKT